MKLSEEDKKVIVALGANGELTDDALGKATDLSPHRARYVKRKLLERKVVDKQMMIDPYALGFGRYNLYCSLRPTAWKQREECIKKLNGFTEVVFVQELGGEFELEISIAAKSSREALEFCYSLPALLGNNITTKSVTTRHLMAYFPRKYLARIKLPVSGWVVGGDPEIVACDQLDYDILHVACEEPELSGREIARKLGKVYSTVDARIRRLRKEKVIIGSFYTPYATQYDAKVFKLLVFCRTFSRELRKKLFMFVQSHPHGTFFNQSFGAWDFEIGVEGFYHEDLLAFRSDLMSKFEADIERISVLTRFKVHTRKKFGLRNWNADAPRE